VTSSLDVEFVGRRDGLREEPDRRRGLDFPGRSCSTLAKLTAFCGRWFAPLPPLSTPRPALLVTLLPPHFGEKVAVRCRSMNRDGIGEGLCAGKDSSPLVAGLLS